MRQSFERADAAGWRYGGAYRTRRVVDASAPSVGVWELERWDGERWCFVTDRTTYAEIREAADQDRRLTA